MPADSVAAQDRLHVADNLLRGGALGEAEGIYRQLIADTPDNPEAYFGLGVAEYQRGDFKAAEYALRSTLDLSPKHDNAFYYLGLISEKRGEEKQAVYYYEKALAINPQNRAAKSNLAAHGDGHLNRDTKPVGLSTPQAQSPEREVELQRADAELGLVGLLKADNSSLSRQTLALIEQLRIDRHPRKSAYFGAIAIRVAAPLLVLVLRSVIPVSPVISLGLFIVTLVPLFWLVIRIGATNYKMDAGQLLITSGVTRRSTKYIQLYHVLPDIEIEQTVLNRMTGDGLLVLALEKETVELTGLAPFKELQDIANRLRNLILLLRSNPNLKGIIR